MKCPLDFGARLESMRIGLRFLGAELGDVGAYRVFDVARQIHLTPAGSTDRRSQALTVQLDLWAERLRGAESLDEIVVGN